MMHLKPTKGGRAAAEVDPLVAITGGGGVNLYNSAGSAWTADYLKVTGEVDVDLRNNIAAEARAKVTDDRLMKLTDDQGTVDALQFLMRNRRRNRHSTPRSSIGAAGSIRSSPAIELKGRDPLGFAFAHYKWRSSQVITRRTRVRRARTAAKAPIWSHVCISIVFSSDAAVLRLRPQSAPSITRSLTRVGFAVLINSTPAPMQ